MLFLSILTLTFFIQMGCSYQFIDDRGARHVIGLAHIVTQESHERGTDVIAHQVTTLGIAVMRIPENQGFSIGYTRDFSLQVLSGNTAGEIAFNPNDPSEYTYTPFQTILEEYQ